MHFTARSKEFMTEEGQRKASSICKFLGLDNIIAIDGDGTFRGAQALSRYAVQRQAAQDGDRHHQAEENPYRGLLRYLGGTSTKGQDGTEKNQIEVRPTVFP